MADCGLEIEEDQLLHVLRLTIPPFLHVRGKQDFSCDEVIRTQHTAPLKIHTEQAMDWLKNLHVFDNKSAYTQHFMVAFKHTDSDI